MSLLAQGLEQGLEQETAIAHETMERNPNQDATDLAAAVKETDTFDWHTQKHSHCSIA